MRRVLLSGKLPPVPFYLLSYQTPTQTFSSIQQDDSIYADHAADHFRKSLPEDAEGFTCVMVSSLTAIFKEYEVGIWRVEERK